MKIFISAGEVSGDIHGSYLLQELKKLRSDLKFYGVGSERLAAEGMDVRIDIIRRGTIGILEALPNVIPVLAAFQKAKKILREERPDLVVMIDSQGFNMPLARFCKKIGLKTVYYVAPQEWLWGTERGAKKVAATISLIIAIFEKEYRSYLKAGANVAYFGHPLLDIVKPTETKEEARRRLIGADVHPATPVISLCPGSRLQEIKGLLPIMLEAGRKIKKALPQARFIIPVASTRIIEEIFGMIKDDFRPKAIVGETYNLLYAADLNICASGTINLESSILGVPNIMLYKLSLPTYLIGKYILRIDRKIKYFSMPNILTGQKIIPELVMGDANPENLADEAMGILQDRGRIDKMKEGFFALRTLLGSGGAIQKTAEKILSF